MTPLARTPRSHAGNRGARAFPQVATIVGVFIDGEGRRAEVILLDRSHGPQQWIRVSYRGILLGDGYYRNVEAALALMDAATTVEVVTLSEPPNRL